MRERLSVDISPLFNHTQLADEFCFNWHEVEASRSLEGVTFANGVFDGSSAKGLELVNGQFVDSHLGKSVFHQCRFEKFEFRNCKFFELDFRDCALIEVEFVDCYLFQMSIDRSLVSKLKFQTCEFITSSFCHSTVQNLTIDDCLVTPPPGALWGANGVDELSLKALDEHGFKILE